MSYISDNLMPNEEIKYDSRESKFALYFGILFGIFLLSLGGLGILVILYSIYSYYTVDYTITNKRVVTKKGWIGRSTVETNVQKIETVSFNQGILQRLFNCGNITIVGTGGVRHVMRTVDNPKLVRDTIIQQMSA